jgi:hypothetical protein
MLMIEILIGLLMQQQPKQREARRCSIGAAGPSRGAIQLTEEQASRDRGTWLLATEPKKATRSHWPVAKEMLCELL